MRRPVLRMRVILLVPLLALFAFVATTEERAEAEDVATRVEGENFDEQPIGTSVVTNTTLYAPPDGQALKFTNDTATAIKREVTFNSQGDVMLWARGGQSGGSPTLSVNVDGGAFSTAQPIRNSGAPVAYTYNLNVPTGLHTIGVKAANTGLGRNPFVDYVTFPPSPTPDGSLTYIGSATGDTGTKPQVKVTVPVPLDTQQGDVMLALLQADYGNVGGTLPSGWKLIKEHLEGRDLSLHAYYKIAAATEPSSYTWNVVNTALHPLAGGTILTFRGVDQASPVFASTVNPETADRAKINCPSVNAPSGGMRVCGFTHDDPQPDINVPASMTRVSNFIIRNDDAHAVAYEPIAQAGATGLRSATINPDIKGGKNDISMAISLRPSAVNSPSPGPKPTPPNKKTAPRVLSTFPKANAKAVAPKASLRATFSEKMRASSINTKTFKLFKKKGSTKKLSARVTYNAATKKATLNPTTSLRKGLTYKAVLSPGAKDVAGKSLDQKRTAKGLQRKVWSFTVRK